ncbi:NADH:ubiquinone oxidoreductase 20.1kD subunit [Diaporthe helianthi]|uniref:NADH:ubiquinone oxidoreductase 20.1kD subunit n=1 Tax=Diaporthe helianthi TaxID=158607 RepID=A0A2P5I488_DIAHE|nr:NADH:ubiquinone oxidoreductase 20.1kD subunit [Diaporthe helianthi]
MLSRRIAAKASPLRSATAAVAARRLPIVPQRTFLPEYNKDIEERYPAYPQLSDVEDPNMNGGYIQPAPVKRQFRDPLGDWWDKQERRNYGEPCHEDYDQMGIFTPHVYTWVSPKKGLVQIAAFIATALGVCYAVKATYPDRPSFPREFVDGLQRELGGPGAKRARAPEDPEPFQVEELD